MRTSAVRWTLKCLPCVLGAAFISLTLLVRPADANQERDSVDVRLTELEQRIEELAQRQRRADDAMSSVDAESAAWTGWTPAEWRERYWQRRMMEARP